MVDTPPTREGLNWERACVTNLQLLRRSSDPTETRTECNEAATLPGQLSDETVSHQVQLTQTIDTRPLYCHAQTPATEHCELDLLSAMEYSKKIFTDLNYLEKKSEAGVVLFEVQNRNVRLIPDAGYMSVTRVLFSQNSDGCVDYVVQSLYTTIESGVVTNLSEFTDICNIVSDRGAFKFCPGISEKKYYDEYHLVIRYHIETLRIWEKPFRHIDSRSCLLWHQLAHNAKSEEKLANDVLCKACKRLVCDLDYQSRRSSDVSPSKQIKRLQPSSNFKLKYLSPASVAKRKRATQQERSHDKEKLQKHDDLDITLEDDQSDELRDIVTKLEEIAKPDLEKIFAEADNNHVGYSVRNTWECDLSWSFSKINKGIVGNFNFFAKIMYP